MILNEDPESITALRLDVPASLVRIVEKTLAKRADERYQGTDEVLADLRAVSWGGEAVSASLLDSTVYQGQAGAEVPADGWHTATVMIFDGDRVILYDFRGPYLGTFGSNLSLRLVRGAIQRNIPYREIHKIEFDKSLGPKWYEHPIVTMRKGMILKLEEGEAAVYTGGLFSGPQIHGKDKDGHKLSVPIIQIKSIEFG